jgi:putative membrane protein
MKLPMLLTGFLFVSGLASGHSTDSTFMSNAAKGGMAEVELGELAQQKATSPAVKQFGERMIKDHSDANDKLKAIAAAKGVALPETASVLQQASKAKLNLMSGKDFDKSYIKGMVSDHKADIKEFQDEAANGKDPDLKAFARATLPTLQAHLKRAESIASSEGVSE